MREGLIPFGLVLLMLSAVHAQAQKIVPEVVSSFNTPGGAILGMTYGNGSLWLADENRIIYQLNASGQVQSQFSHSIDGLDDLAWFENTLWAWDGTNVFKLNLSGQILETIPASQFTDYGGMEWAEGSLYVTDFGSSNVHKYGRSGTHIYSWPTQFFGRPQDMIYDGASLWITDDRCDGPEHGIWEYSLTGTPGRWIDVSAIDFCVWPTKRALAWDGRYFWWASLLTVYKLNIGGDDVPPVASVVSPSGGEYWLLSDAGSPPNTQVVTWSMSDNVRICQVRVSLWYSNDGGASYQEAPSGGGLPQTFGPGGACTGAGELTTSLTYTIPTVPPSGTTGSLYKIQVEATDAAGNTLAGGYVRSTNPFYIVRANPDSVRTVILKNSARLPSAPLDLKLQELAGHPRVQGLVVDLAGVTDISELYANWDADSGNANKANAVIFGCHPPYPAGCPTDRQRNGIHDHLRSLLVASDSSATYSGVKYLVLVGDDRIIPMARIQDRTALLPESNYPAGGDIRAIGSTVGAALAADKYLTDDPLAVLDPIAPGDLSGNVFIPDLAVGRLVETPQEIVTTIATYIGQDGILDLSLLDPNSGHKVLVTGYDFLSNVATHMRSRWKSSLGVNTPNTSTAPVDGTLVGGSWGYGSVSARATALRTSISGNGGARYGIMAIAGHATHFEEGVPGTDPFDIQGLSTADLYGPDSCGTATLGAVSLAGGVVYAVGCHGGLPVPGSCRTDADRSLDLPQTMMSRGVVAYVANSGYGWGLRYGIGYAGRLVQIFTEEMSSGGTIAVGDAVRQSKQRYYLETPRYDSYDEKTMMQWTLFGLPMYAVKTGIVAGASMVVGTTGERIEGVRVTRRLSSLTTAGSTGVFASALPAYVTQLNLTFDFTAAGVYDKHDSTGAVLPAGQGCPDANGCYYTLNGLVDRGTGSADIPIQPYLIYDSRLAGTSQHGVLWKGGTYDEESGWKPVFAELLSNGGDGSNHGAAPRIIKLRPIAPRIVPGVDSPSCRPSDLEMNSITVAAGEAVKPQAGDLEYTIARRYRTMDLEVFYYNNRNTPADNCDRSGPQLGSGPYGGNYHQISGTNVQWSVPVIDSSGVWRVVVVYTTNAVDSQSRGTWLPAELTNNGDGTFGGSVSVPPATRVTYVIEAVDTRGNVTWLEWVSAQVPSSGVPLGVPQTLDVTVSGTAISVPSGVLATATSATSVAISWNMVAEASRYDVYRRAANGDYALIGSSLTTNFADSGAAPTSAYLYAVKAVDASNNASALSAADLATTINFTDPVLSVSSTLVKAAHVAELRLAVNAVRRLAGIADAGYTDPVLTPGTTVAKAAHLTELRATLDAARSALSLSAASYAESIAAGTTTIRAAHITELRDGVR